MRFENKKVEDCFDGSFVYEYNLESPVTEAFIPPLGGRLGRLEYFPDFPRPFFRILGDGGLQAKGVEGERTFRVVFPAKDKFKRKEVLEDVLKKL